MKIHSFLTPKKLLNTQELESDSCKPSNIYATSIILLCYYVLGAGCSRENSWEVNQTVRPKNCLNRNSASQKSEAKRQESQSLCLFVQ